MTWMRRQLNSDEGFTLIELMVVVLIIAILIAIAIPTFLGARERAQDRAAQSNLRNGLTAEKVYYVDEEAYTASVAALTAIEPSLTFQTTASADSSEVYTRVANLVTPAVTGGIVCMEVLSASGTVFFLGDIVAGSSAGTYYAEGTQTCSLAVVEALGSAW